MNHAKLCRSAKYFSAKASNEMHQLRSSGFGLNDSQHEFQQVRLQVIWLESVIDGLSTLMWHLGGTKALESRERTAMRSKYELVRYLSDLHLDKLDTDVVAAHNLYVARAFVLEQRQPLLSIFTFGTAPTELVTQ